MSVTRPKFVDSPYFVMEVDNWHLKPGAPPEVVSEFEKWIKQQEEANERGVFL